MLNNKLKQENSQRVIIAFFWIPCSTIRIKPNLIENRAYYEDIRDILDEVFPDVKNRIMRDLVSKSAVNVNDLFEKGSLFEISKRINLFLKKGNPPLCTHDIEAEHNDQIISSFVSKGLLNRQEDKVKVIFYPIYLNGADRLLDLNYQESMMGCHLGVFPSYYEPWGYTPLESAALGVSAITTNFGGFGRYIKPHLKEKNPGIFVIDIFDKTENEGTKDLFRSLYEFSKLSKEDRVKNKTEAKNTASLVDWKYLIKNYLDAHNMAINKTYKK
jgi:glycogen(starch) synthase